MASRRFLLYGLLGLAVIGIYLLSQVLLVTLLSALVAAVVAIYVDRRMSRSGGAPGAEQPGEQPEDPATAWVSHLRSLLDLNIRIRERGLWEEVTPKLEEIIDELREIVPQLNFDYVGSELTWTVNRMATDYLPRIVDPYLELSPGARTDNQQELLQSLAGLESELSNIADLVKNHREGDFKAKAAFLRVRFLDSPG